MDTTIYTATKHAGIKANADHTEILLDFRVKGKRYRKKISYPKTLGTKKDRLENAQEALIAYKNELRHISTGGDVMKMTMNEYFDRTQKASDRSDAYKKKLQSFWNKYIKDSVGDLKVREAQTAHITQIMNTLKEAGLAKSTQKKALECLVPIFKMAIDEGVIIRTPIRSTHNIKRDSTKEKKVILSAKKKYQLVYRQIFLTLHHTPKIRALTLLCFHGRRKTEACRLKWENVDLESRTYRIAGEDAKPGVDMIFTLPEDIALILETLPRVSEYVFWSEKDPSKPVDDIRHHVYKLRDDTGIRELTLHWMRNLAVSALSEMGVGALELSAMLGHTDPDTLRKYLTLQREAATRKINEINRIALT